MYPSSAARYGASYVAVGESTWVFGGVDFAESGIAEGPVPVYRSRRSRL